MAWLSCCNVLDIHVFLKRPIHPNKGGYEVICLNSEADNSEREELPMNNKEFAACFPWRKPADSIP